MRTGETQTETSEALALPNILTARNLRSSSGGETMADPMDRELELVKLQIAANSCQAELQTYNPTYFTMAVAFLALAYSIMPQMGIVLFLVFMVSLAILGGLAVRVISRYENGIRRLNGGIEDFKAHRPLPSLTYLCDIKKKKRVW
jgi:hypothetical protein